MKTIVSIDEWMAARHPDKIISEPDEIERLTHTPGTAWRHMYSFSRDLDFIMDDAIYKELEQEYLGSVALIKVSNERERVRNIYK